MELTESYLAVVKNRVIKNRMWVILLDREVVELRIVSVGEMKELTYMHYFKTIVKIESEVIKAIDEATESQWRSNIKVLFEDYEYGKEQAYKITSMNRIISVEEMSSSEKPNVQVYEVICKKGV